jgi:uncharacterized protein YxjI
MFYYKIIIRSLEARADSHRDHQRASRRKTVKINVLHEVATGIMTGTDRKANRLTLYSCRENVMSMKTRVGTHEGLNIYRVDTRGQTFYKSDRIYGEEAAGKTVDEVKKKITARLAAGDTRVQVETHEGVNIYRVTEGGKQYYISDPILDETIRGDTIYQVALEITRKHAMVGF